MATFPTSSGGDDDLNIDIEDIEEAAKQSPLPADLGCGKQERNAF